jgi:hypothetical protein
MMSVLCKGVEFPRNGWMGIGIGIYLGLGTY